MLLCQSHAIMICIMNEDETQLCWLILDVTEHNILQELASLLCGILLLSSHVSLSQDALAGISSGNCHFRYWWRVPDWWVTKTLFPFVLFEHACLNTPGSDFWLQRNLTRVVTWWFAPLTLFIHAFICRERLVGSPSYWGGSQWGHCLSAWQRWGKRTHWVYLLVLGGVLATSFFFLLRSCVRQVWYDFFTYKKHNGGQNLYIPVTMSSVRQEKDFLIIYSHKLLHPLSGAHFFLQRISFVNIFPPVR